MSQKTNAIIESILFAAGDSISKSQLAEILEISEKKVENEIEKLRKFYIENERAEQHIPRWLRRGTDSV